jgi:hypothetical protein
LEKASVRLKICKNCLIRCKATLLAFQEMRMALLIFLLQMLLRHGTGNHSFKVFT